MPSMRARPTRICRYWWTPRCSAALHVLTVGALAGLIMGMIARTALGHTGRPLKAGRGYVPYLTAARIDGREG